MTLNPAQQAAVDSTAALKVVIAGPGSGKTRTMVEAVKRAACADFHHSRIAIMTFTNAGANEFRARLDGTKVDYCGTLHGYCFKLIQRFGGFLGYIPGKVGILPDAERIPRLLACRDKLGLKVSQKAILARLPSTWVATGATPESIVEGTALVWKEYEFLLKRNNLCDYDLILREGLALLQMREVRAQVGLDYLFCDEHQDASQIDQLIYEMIPARNKMYVGDPDQSIFGFRGAYPIGMVRRASGPLGDSIAFECFKLELNYRSDTEICFAANLLIGHNKERVVKIIYPTTEERGGVEINNYEDVGMELAMIASTARTAFETARKATVAVLYRMNHDVKQCRDYLHAMGIPVQVPKFEQRPPDWERAMLLLALCQSPENEILVQRFLKLDNDAGIVDRWLIESRAAGKALSAYFGSIWSWAGTPSLELIPQLLAKKGVSEGTVRLITDRMKLLAPDADLGDLLHDLHSGEAEKAPDGASEGVYVGTIHSAKGREWDVVFLPAFEQGIIPSNKVDELEENRRLAFVAVTRAKHELYISWCSTRRLKWETRADCQPSQFIAEMGL